MKKLMGILLALVLMASGTALADFDAASEIFVVSREDGSGTRGAFVELFGVLDAEKIDNTTEEAIITNSTSIMLTTVAGNPHAIGYVSMGSLNDTVKALPIDGAQPTTDQVKAGTYKIARPFNIATSAEVSDAAQDFIGYILSTEGQQVVSDSGYIALDETQPYAMGAAEGKIVIAGSSSVTPVMEKLKEAYAALQPNVAIEIQQSDSTTGMTAAVEGICDIGMASRELKESEIEAGLNGTVIAMDGIAVIVNNECPVDGLTTEQVRAIYMGETTLWSAVQ